MDRMIFYLIISECLIAIYWILSESIFPTTEYIN
jgi:hypothetical protein